MIESASIIEQLQAQARRPHTTPTAAKLIMLVAADIANRLDQLNECPSLENARLLTSAMGHGLRVLVNQPAPSRAEVMLSALAEAMGEPA